MKTFHICFPNGSTNIVHAPFGTTVQSVAEEYPSTNIYWLDAPLSLPPSEYRVIRYTPN